MQFAAGFPCILYFYIPVELPEICILPACYNIENKG